MKPHILLALIPALGLASPVSLINPSVEVNNGTNLVPLSSTEVPGWEGDAALSEGDNDYGNGRWKIIFDQTGDASQLTSHQIQTGESFSIRFDAALAPDLSFIPAGAIIGGSLLNGDFDGDNSSFDLRIFSDTPGWFNLAGDQNLQATTLSEVPGESRQASLTDGGDRLFAIETGYTLTEGQKLDLSFRWRDGDGWDDASDQIRVTLFTTSDDTPSGTRNDLESVTTGPSTANASFENFATTFPPISAPADGKKLFVLLEGVDGNVSPDGEAEVDDFVLSLFNPLLIGPGLRNGDFAEDTSISDSRTFEETPAWTNIGGGQGAQATRTNLPYNGTRTTVLNQTTTQTIFGNDTGHTLATGDVLTVKFVWRDAASWNDAADRVATFLYTTSNDDILGPQTILQTLLTPLSSSDSTWEDFNADFDPIPAAAAGKRLFVAFRADNGDGVSGFGRVADFRLSVNDDDPALPPTPPEPASGDLIAEAFVDNNGSKEIIASRLFTLNQARTTEWAHYHLAIPAGVADAFAGQEIGVSFRGPDGNDSLIRYVDNVRLDAYPADPTDGSFSNNWNNSPNRVWPGPGYWGNRLHDWEVRNNRVNCFFRGKPRRVLHRVGTSIRGNGSNFTLSVRTGLASGTNGTGAKTGFLIGAGPNLDWRGSLLVHDGLGRDFGTFLGINHNGAAIIDDLSQGSVSQVATGATPAGGFQADTRIDLVATYNATLGEYTLTVSAFDTNGTLLSTTSTSVTSDRVLGSFGLVSNRSNNGSAYWFDDFSGSGDALKPEPERSLAIIGALHTLHDGILRLTAHVPPVARTSTPPLTLETWDGSSWIERNTASIDNTDNLSSYTATFEVSEWDDTLDTPYRVGIIVDGQTYYWNGTVRKDPIEKNEIVVINTSCQRIADGSVEADTMDWSPVKMWHPHLLAFKHINKQNGDVLLALGDQIYEGQPTPENSDTDFNRQHDYLYKWYLWMLQVRDYSRDIPTISIPDDHDIFQGNLWGEGGIATTSQNTGGYEEPASWVRLVERTQTSHMPTPDPYNPVQPAPPIAQGIQVYFTGITYGGVGFAVLEDRKFKTGSQNFPADLDQQFLLGERQKDFLKAWSTDWAGQKVKCIVSQTPFGMIHTHASTGYGYGINDRDSNGWPSHRREEAWELFRLSRSFQLAGDQHIGTLVHHGIDGPADAGYSFTSPAISNFFPRVWDPEHSTAGRTETVSDYKGDFFLNGVGNLPTGSPNLTSQLPGHIRVVGAANPLEYYNQSRNMNPANLHDRSAGYGVIRIEKTSRQITFECWPLHADPEFPQTGSQFPDWPVTINQTDNDGRTSTGFLPVLNTLSEKDPVISVYDELTNELVYSMRFPGNLVRLPIYDNSRTYRIELSYGDGPVSEIFSGQTASQPGPAEILSFSALQPSIVTGDSTTLQWNVSGATTLTIDNGLGDVTNHTINGIGHLQISPTEDTTYTLIMNGVESSMTTVSVFPTQATWLQQNFSAAQLADPLITGDQADPDGDGISNLDEYRFQTLPQDASSRPALTSDIVLAGKIATLDFASPFPLRAETCTLRIEVSTDQRDWSALGSNLYQEVERIHTGPGTTRIRVRFNDDVGDTARKFYRAIWESN